MPHMERTREFQIETEDGELLKIIEFTRMYEGDLFEDINRKMLGPKIYVTDTHHLVIHLEDTTYEVLGQGIRGKEVLGKEQRIV